MTAHQMRSRVARKKLRGAQSAATAQPMMDRTRTASCLANPKPSDGTGSDDRQRELQLIAACIHDARGGGNADSYSGKRRDRRTIWERAVTVEVDSDAPQRRLINAQSRDISERGMGLRCRTSLAAGAEVRIYVDHGDEFICGRVRHSTRSLADYVIGIEFAHR